MGNSSNVAQLLEQQGAKVTPDMQSKFEDDNSKSSYSPIWQKPQKQEQVQEERNEEDKHSESLNKFP